MGKKTQLTVLLNKYILIHFMRRKRDPRENLIIIVNIGGAGVEIKKIKL